MFPTKAVPTQSLSCDQSSTLTKRINNEKDVIFFKTQSPAYKNILDFVNLLCERVHGTRDKVLNSKYQLHEGIFIKCSKFLDDLEKSSEETNLNAIPNTGTLRFGHIAFRGWFDNMCSRSKEFVENEIAEGQNEKFKEELYTYLTSSFGNKMRIDYGTGHELNFVIFLMGLSLIVPMDTEIPEGDTVKNMMNKDSLKSFVKSYGYDIHFIFGFKYMKICRQIQSKFRLEPAGSRGVYNMDDFQFLPFLFGAAQLMGSIDNSVEDFYHPEEVKRYRDDFIFYAAVDFILKNKRGPFSEHSYRLWGLANLGSWDTIYHRIKPKFIDEVLSPFPIAQHLLFGDYVFRWNP